MGVYQNVISGKKYISLYILQKTVQKLNKKPSKKLLHIMKTKDIIGDFDYNFIAPKSVQYEAMTKIEAMKFI